MPNIKIYFDEFLGQQLRQFRNDYNIKANDVAEHINKSPAYISKLEKGQIKQISKNSFTDIVNFITNSKNGYSIFTDKISESFDIDQLERSNFISNFDWIERKIPIPDEYSSYVINKMKELGFSCNSLAEYVNQNEDLDDDFFREQHLTKEQIEPNNFIVYYEIDSKEIQRNFILIRIDASTIQSIANGKASSSCYLFLYAIIYHLLKKEEKNRKIILDEEDRSMIKKKTSEVLKEFKIYTIPEKQSAIIKAKQDISPSNYLSIYDIKNKQLMDAINATLYVYSEKDIDYVNIKLSSILKNLTDNNSFALAFMALDLSALTDSSPSIKKEFLSSVEKLIKEYSTIPRSGLEKY